jgi:hypothetical protein
MPAFVAVKNQAKPRQCPFSGSSGVALSHPVAGETDETRGALLPVRLILSVRNGRDLIL